EPVLRGRAGAGGEDAAGQAGLRPLADRRPVGDRARPGPRRGDGDHGRARPCAAALGARKAAFAEEPPGRRVPLAGERLISRRGLTLGEPFAGGVASELVAPVATADGEQAVLKVQHPHRESEHEAAALELWDGDGAIRLLAHDPAHDALLLERCVPGTPLADAGAEAAMDVFVELLPRLWKPAGPPFGTLAAEAAWWADSLADTWERFDRPFERRLLDAALEAL